MSNNIVQELAEVLHLATLPEQSRREFAEGRISELKNGTPFYMALLEIYRNQNLALHVRQLSLILLRTGIKNLWRLKEGECPLYEIKNDIRLFLLDSLNETDSRLSTQINEALACIIGSDYPSECPNVLLDFINKVGRDSVFGKNGAFEGPSTFNFNILSTLDLSLNNLCSKALPSTRYKFFKCSPGITLSLFQCFRDQIAYVFGIIERYKYHKDYDISNIVSAFKFLNTQFRCLNSVIVYGFKIQELSEERYTTIAGLFNIFVNIYGFSRAENLNNDLKDEIETLVQGIMSLFQNIIESNPKLYNSLSISESLICFCIKEISEVSARNDYQDMEYYGQFLDFIKTCISCDAISQEIQETVLSPDLIADIASKISTQISYTTDAALYLWKTNPSEYILNSNGPLSDYNFGTIVGNFIKTLPFKYQNKYLPIIIETTSREFKSIGKNPTLIDSKEKVLFIDNLLYNLCCFSNTLQGFMDIDSWLLEYVHPVIEILMSNNVLKCRLTKLLGILVRLKDSGNLGDYYKYFVQLLECEDLVISMEAASSLQLLVEDLNFKSNEFKPFLEKATYSLLKLLHIVDDQLLKARIVFHVSEILEKMDTLIQPYLPEIITQLSREWNENRDGSLLRSEIARAFSRFVRSIIRIYPGTMCEIVINIIGECLRSNDTDSCNLEDGLTLWSATLIAIVQEFDLFEQKCSGILEITSSLLSLFPYLLDIMSYGTEFPEKVIDVLKSYFILSTKKILETYSSRIFSLLNNIIPNLRIRSMNPLFECVDTMLLSAHCIDSFFLVEEPLITSGFLERIILGFMNDTNMSLITNGYFVIIGRIAISNAKFLVNFINHLAQSKLEGRNAEFIDAFITAIERKSPSLKGKVQERVCGMAVVALLSSEDDNILNQTHRIFGILSEVFEKSELASSDDQFFALSEEEKEEEEQQPNIIRRILSRYDPIFTNVFVLTFVEGCINQILEGPSGHLLRQNLQFVPVGISNPLRRYLTSFSNSG